MPILSGLHHRYANKTATSLRPKEAWGPDDSGFLLWQRKRGDKVNLAGLAGRIESLQLLYQALSPDTPEDEIDLGHYLSQIAAAVVNTYAADGIRLDLKVDHAPVSVNVALPVGLS